MNKEDPRNAVNGQTGRLIAKIVENLPPMSAKDMQAWIDSPLGVQRALKFALCPLEEVKSVFANFTLSLVQVERVARFVVAEHFKTGNGAGVVFRGFHPTFVSEFLDKVETDIPAAELIIHTLREDSSVLDAEIIAELGIRYETTLYHLWEMLKRQPTGVEKEARLGLPSSQSSAFYIRNNRGRLRVVSVDWNNDGWYILCTHKAGCSNVARVFSL
ncbi:MAG: hypothetical protein WC268_04530 [Patescibacteria group bacterium]|jgi:hypothetical protein